MKMAIEFEGSIYTFHAIGTPDTTTNCKLCDARHTPLCTEYSLNKKQQAMCALLGSAIRKDEKAGKRLVPQGYWKRRTYDESGSKSSVPAT